MSGVSGPGRLGLPEGWGEGWDPLWVPPEHGESWLRVFAAEDQAGQLLAAARARRIRPEDAPRELLADLGSELWQCILQYRVQLRATWEELDRCPRKEHHDQALRDSIEAVADQPEEDQRSWRIMTFDDELPVEIATEEGRGRAEGRRIELSLAAPHPRVFWIEPVPALAG